MSTRFAYDDVPYDSEANADTHPSAIATLARLAGLSTAAPSTSRVLEIGCGNGENLIAAATYLPRARFVGFDLAAEAVAAGMETAKAGATENVTLFAADIRDVRAGRVTHTARAHDNRSGRVTHTARAHDNRSARTNAALSGPFDYVIAHGMYSWVPEDVRADLLALIRDVLAPDGIGFLSVNALPGWELRRALRELARDATASLETPEAKVTEALRVIAELGLAGKNAHGFFGALSAAAREYEEHVRKATPPEAPFSRYVFHDLLADCNDPFSVTELATRLTAHRLRIVCEAPLRPRDAAVAGRPQQEEVERALTASGTPFLQVLVQRDDAKAPHAPDATLVADLELWADLEPVKKDTYRTTTGAVVRPAPDDGLSRAARSAPGFVAVRELVGDDEALIALSRQLFAGFCEGVFTLVAERPPCRALTASASSLDAPRVAEHVRLRAERASGRGDTSAVLTNALHRSFRVPWAELAIVRLLDGRRRVEEIAAGARASAMNVPASLAGPLAGGCTDDGLAFVSSVISRFARHLFLVEAT